VGILYDSGTTGWAVVQPAAFSSGISPRGLVIVNSGGGTAETVEIIEVNPAVTSTTIGSISYDSGLTGACVIQMAAPASSITGLVRNGLIKLGAGGTLEFVRVISVTSGPGNTLSFRCSTVNNHVAGDALTGVASFRAFFANNHLSGETLAINVVQSTVAAGLGTIDKTIAIDLSTIGTQPSNNDDLLHISISLDVPANLVEGRVYLDMDSATNDFTRNADYVAFRQSDLQAAVSNTITTITSLQQAIQNQQIDKGASQPPFSPGVPLPFPRRPFSGPSFGAPFSYLSPNLGLPVTKPALGSPSTQTATGGSQWSELLIPLGQLQRIGTDSSRTLANVAKVRVQINVTASTVVQFGAILIRGGFGPDVGQVGSPIFYRHRGRSSVTGSKSNPSPASRYGLAPRRDQITVTMAQHPDTQYDKLDVFRFGGALTAQLSSGVTFWAYVGTTANSASPTFADTFLDSDIADAPALDFDNFQPFPDIDITRSGTCNVTGTTVTWVSGDSFNLNWAQGSEIIIKNQLYHLYAQPTSTTRLEIAESGGTQAAVSFFLPQPTLLNQKLPVMWGPWNGMFFACGSPNQPGYLFGTKRNNPDSAPDKYQWEVSSPSEPCVGGFMWGPLAFVSTSERTFQILPSADPNRVVELQEVPGAGGLWSRWGVAPGLVPYKIERDGIYAMPGGSHQSITAPHLNLLFPHDGQPGQTVTLGSITFSPPDFTNTANLRLSYENSHLIFNYIDTTGTRRKMIYSEIFGVWTIDTLPFAGVYDYVEEGLALNSVLIGGADGNLYQSTGTLDGAANVASEIRMPWMGGLPGFTHVRDGYLGLVSAAPSNFVINGDGTDNTVVIPATAGYSKVYTPLPPVKAKVLEFAFNSAQAFELYLADAYVNAKTWGSGAAYDKLNPFAPLLS
jgi:hypothetical protein